MIAPANASTGSVGKSVSAAPAPRLPLPAPTVAPSSGPVPIPDAIANLKAVQDILSGAAEKYRSAGSYDELNKLERSLIDATSLIATAQDTAASVQRYGVMQLLRNSTSMIDRVSGMGYAQWELLQNVAPEKRADAAKALAESSWPQTLIGTAMSFNGMAIQQFEEMLRG
jgi:hypothetical protein